MQTSSVMVPIVFGGRLPLTLNSNFNEILEPTGYNTGPVLHWRSSPNIWPESDHHFSMLLLFRETIMSNLVLP